MELQKCIVNYVALYGTIFNHWEQFGTIPACGTIWNHRTKWNV